MIGDGGGWWSFLHVDDAAEATALAVERGAPGVYNIVDDEPAPVREWLPELARMLRSSAKRGFERLGAMGEGQLRGDRETAFRKLC